MDTIDSRVILRTSDDLHRGVDKLTEFARDFEVRNPLRVKRHVLSGARVSSNARRTFLHAKRAEATELDMFVATERVGNGLKKSVDYGFGLELRQPGSLSYSVDDIGFGHRAMFDSVYEALEYTRFGARHSLQWETDDVTSWRAERCANARDPI
jgi:hypothetical protein